MASGHSSGTIGSEYGSVKAETVPCRITYPGATVTDTPAGAASNLVSAA